MQVQDGARESHMQMFYRQRLEFIRRIRERSQLMVGAGTDKQAKAVSKTDIVDISAEGRRRAFEGGDLRGA